MTPPAIEDEQDVLCALRRIRREREDARARRFFAWLCVVGAALAFVAAWAVAGGR